jgi:hypothetical protein
MSPSKDPSGDAAFPMPIGSFVGAAVVYFVDAFLLNQGALAVLVALVAVVALIPALIAGALARSWTTPLAWTLRAGAFASAAAAVLATNAWQNAAAHRRAEDVIVACERYHDANGRYPDALADLAPRFLPGEPRAKYVFMFGRFSYHTADAAHHTLGYTTLPPFGRPFYVLEEARWGYLD